MRLLEPQRIVIGGGLAKAGDALLTPLTTYLTRTLAFQAMPELALSTVGSNAGVLGAAIFAQSRFAKIAQK
jgi:glucokinase